MPKTSLAGSGTQPVDLKSEVAVLCARIAALEAELARSAEQERKAQA